MTGVWVGFDQPKTIISNGYAADVAVPIWASFMKRATKGDKPDWLDKPANVVMVNVCRMSGKLPGAGCDSVQVVTKDGLLEKRSMIYGEYFAKGTQPTTVCPLHDSPSILDRLAGAFGKDNHLPIPADSTGLPMPPATSTSGNTPASASADKDHGKTDQQSTDEPKKKKGFWSRVFGGGDKKADDDKKKEEERKKQEEQRKRDERKKQDER